MRLNRARSLLPGSGARSPSGSQRAVPVSSLGHAVVFPACSTGTTWSPPRASPSRSGSPSSLRFTWARPSLSSCSSGRTGRRSSEVCSIPRRARTITTPTERLGWLLVVRDHPRRHHRSRSRARAARAVLKAARSLDFSHCHGFILFGGEAARRHAEVRERRGHLPPRELKTLEFKEAGVIGTAQVLALLAGISRSGVTMVAGLIRGLDYKDSAKVLLPARDAGDPARRALQDP